MSFEVIDTHLHVYDLELRKSFPNKNNSYDFPNPETQNVIYKVKDHLHVRFSDL
jgi:hypothetical protein